MQSQRTSAEDGLYGFLDAGFIDTYKGQTVYIDRNGRVLDSFPIELHLQNTSIADGVRESAFALFSVPDPAGFSDPRAIPDWLAMTNESLAGFAQEERKGEARDISA